MTGKNIKAVVFDFGGVIELFGGNGVVQDIAEFLHISKVDFSNEYFKHNHLCNVGNLTWEDVILKTVSFFDDSQEAKEHVVTLIREYNKKKKPNKELISLFPKLKEKGLKVAVFSNYKGRLLREKMDKYGIVGAVDEVVVSDEIGFQKPHKEAFEVLFQRLGMAPEEVVFIDDARKSLEKAAEIGYIPILFKDNAQLKVELKNLGIDVGFSSVLKK